MKIDIDLTEIFEDEDGKCISKSLSEKIEAAIVEQAQISVIALVKRKFEQEITNQVSVIVKEQLTELITDLLDKEFKPVGQYGSLGEPTTLRNCMCKDVERMLTWKDSNYSSEQSMYTTLVKTVVSEKLKEFSREFTKTVDEKLVAECMQYAINKLRRGID